jgi:hypothetical protein
MARHAYPFGARSCGGIAAGRGSDLRGIHWQTSMWLSDAGADDAAIAWSLENYPVTFDTGEERSAYLDRARLEPRLGRWCESARVGNRSLADRLEKLQQAIG